MVLDFGNNVFSFVYGTFTGGLSEGWGPTIFGTKGKVIGSTINGEKIELGEGVHEMGPHCTGVHATMEENHVFEDMMQLVDWIHDENAKPIATAEHAAHVIEIIEMAIKSSETGTVQELQTTFDFV